MRNKIFGLLLCLSISACGSAPLLHDGTYDVDVTFELDRIAYGSYEGETVRQEWVIEDEQLSLFDGQQVFDLVQDGDHYVVDKNEFHLEIYPGNQAKGFDGYWHNEIPGLMFTLASLKGRLRE
jgi:hypothetical protein